MILLRATAGTPWLQTANRIIASVGMTISTASLIMRIYTKGRILRQLWWDDVFIILAWVFSVAAQGDILYGLDHAGIGVHIWELAPATLGIYQKVVLSTAVVYIPALAFAKLALLMLYFKLLHIITRAWRYIIHIIAFIIAAYSTALMLGLIFACNPIQKGWDVTITTGSCISRPSLYLATAITNTASDVILIIIPIPIVWGVKLPLVQRLGVIGMFGIGCLTIVTSILRLATLMPLVSSKDQTYKLAQASIFITIEANFIIICNCLPYLRQFLRYHAPKWIGEGSRESSQNGNGPQIVRKKGLSLLQDDIEQALNGADEMSGGRSNPSTVL